MYTSIDIDFDVWKALTNLRSSPQITENDVLRELLGLNSTVSNKIQTEAVLQDSVGAPWGWKGVTFPHGSEFRAEYNGRIYHAKVDNGALVYEGKLYKSPSAAAMAITGNSVNGWIFWECKMPGKNGWVLIEKLRKQTGKKDHIQMP